MNNLIEKLTLHHLWQKVEAAITISRSIDLCLANRLRFRILMEILSRDDRVAKLTKTLGFLAERLECCNSTLVSTTRLKDTIGRSRFERRYGVDVTIS
jgi:hypothetical protein